jgi:hypothetical protein
VVKRKTGAPGESPGFERDESVRNQRRGLTAGENLRSWYVPMVPRDRKECRRFPIRSLRDEFGRLAFGTRVGQSDAGCASKR